MFCRIQGGLNRTLFIFPPCGLESMWDLAVRLRLQDLAFCILASFLAPRGREGLNRLLFIFPLQSRVYVRSCCQSSPAGSCRLRSDLISSSGGEGCLGQVRPPLHLPLQSESLWEVLLCGLALCPRDLAFLVCFRFLFCRVEGVSIRSSSPSPLQS